MNGKFPWVLVAASVAVPVPVTVASSDESDSVLEEVVVTAERRTASLQDVPVATTSLSADSLEKADIRSTEELQLMVPGLVMSQQITTPTPYIRGVGATQGGVGSEAAVSTYVDGVYVGPVMGGIFSFNNIERIEVLRGPQGTLFGRNTTGGLIHVITKTPTQEFYANFGATYENFDRTSANAYVGGGLSDSVAADLALYFSDQGEGYGHNLLLGHEINYRDELAVRTKLAFEPDKRLSVVLSADYDSLDSDIGINRNAFPGSVYFTGAPRIGGVFDSNSDVPRRTDVDQGGVSVNVSYDTGGIGLSSVTAAREYRMNQDFDQESSPFRLVYAIFDHEESTFQQEFLVQGGSSALEWTAGLFYYQAESIQDLGIVSDVPSVNANRYGEITKTSYAVFGQGTHRFSESTELTLGLRFTVEEHRMSGAQTAQAGNPLPVGTILASAHGAEDEQKEPTWRVALNHHLRENAMVYASLSRGFRAGGFNIVDVSQAPIDPEILDAVEVGFKSEFFDRRVRVNSAIFFYDYDDIQSQAVTSAGVTQTLNASRGEIWGGELEFGALPSVGKGRLEFHGSISYLDAQYKSFENAPFYVPNPGVCSPVPTTLGPPFTGGNHSCVGDASGNDMVRSPEWTATVGFDYSLPIGQGRLGMSAEFFHSEEFFWEAGNRLEQPAYDWVNAQVSYETHDGLRIRAFGKNLFDETYFYWGFESGLGDFAVAAAPRTYGVGIDYSFGGF